MNPDNFRNWLSSLASDLRSRRLLPVLLVLIAAAIAIPIALAKSGKASGVPALPPTPTTTVATAAVLTGTHHHEPPQNYLTGPSHNPFIPIKTTTTASATTTAAGAATTGTGTTASDRSATSGTHKSTGTSTKTTPSSTVTVTTAKTTTVTKTTTAPVATTYANYEVNVSLLQAGVSNTATVFHNIARDALLPNSTSPSIVFLGVLADKETAVFVVGESAAVTGNGRCSPSASSCTFLTLTPGETVKLVDNPSSGAQPVYTFSYLNVRKVSTNASVVTTDPSGARAVSQASAYIPTLKTIRYSRYTGLLSIGLGATVAAAD